jgi:hypothetical protein
MRRDVVGPLRMRGTEGPGHRPASRSDTGHGCLRLAILDGDVPMAETTPPIGPAPKSPQPHHDFRRGRAISVPGIARL